VTERTIGEQELALVRHLADRGGATVGELADTFGRDRGLARSTVLTMVERLRKKGYVRRRLVAGVYRYQAHTSSAELLQGAIRRFVHGTLGGSVAPFVAYLSESAAVSNEELEDLEELVARLQATRKGDEP
jgi:predicted transcriptional regulator